MTVLRYPDFSLEIGEPVVISQGKPYDQMRWGPWQFPTLQRTREGNILYSWAAGRDDISSYEENFSRTVGCVSEDGGLHWRPKETRDVPAGIRLPDGMEFMQPAAKNAYPAPWLRRYAPSYCYEDPRIMLYRADDLAEFTAMPTASVYRKESGTVQSFPMTIVWPNRPAFAFQTDGAPLIFPTEMTMGGMGQYKPAADGSLYLCTYGYGFLDADGSPVRLTGPLSKKAVYMVFVFRSPDGGRNWKYLSGIGTTDEIAARCRNIKEFEGFCEPCMEQLEDGTFLMLMRTGSGNQSYITRSTDGCRTWSAPEVFDSVGVLPQLLRLDCGVLLASYGRPGVFLRATDDPAGLKWEASFDLGVPEKDSCCYTSMMAVSDNEALLAYSHFRVPDPAGVPVKTLLLRRVRVSVKDR